MHRKRPVRHRRRGYFRFGHVANMCGSILFEQIFVRHIQDLFDTL